MFFACVAPAIAFGTLLDTATGGGDGEYLLRLRFDYINVILILH